MGLDRLFIQTVSFWYILLCSLPTDGVVTSLLSRFERLEIFFGKIFVMLFMLCRGGFSQGDPILGEDGNPRVLQHIKECKNYQVAVHRYLHVFTNSHLYCEAVAAESKVKLCLMLGEEEWPLRGLLELILLRYCNRNLHHHHFWWGQSWPVCHHWWADHVESETPRAPHQKDGTLHRSLQRLQVLVSQSYKFTDDINTRSICLFYRHTRTLGLVKFSRTCFPRYWKC